MTDWLGTFNAFIEDTCVIGAVAYGLTRTKALSAFFEGAEPERRTLLGFVFGLLASTEVVFPGARSPYVSHTLIICLAQFAGGAAVSFPAILTVFVLGVVIRGPSEATQTLAALIVVAVIVEGVRRGLRRTPTILTVSLTGGLCQAAALLIRDRLFPLLGAPHLAPYSLASVFANAFGLFVAMLVWQDAQTRLKSEQNRLEAEHAQTMLVAADLAALRARIHPHFMFNTLNAISALCDIDPRKAQSYVLKVSQLLRRHIEVDTTSLTSVETELEYARTYVEIQQVRFGKKANVHFDLEGNLGSLMIPAFSIQTLVENAFLHGLEQKTDQGFIRIAVRPHSNRVTYAVMDNGPGIKADRISACIPDEPMPRHGLGIVDKQLTSLFGNRSRLRIYSSPGLGTTVAFEVPGPNKVKDNVK